MSRVGAVDIGTNSVRLLVADVDGPAARRQAASPLDRRMRITRLGQGVDRTARARTRTRSSARSTCCASTARVLDELRRRRSVRATATSAARDARNRDEFFAAAHDALGVDAGAALAARRRPRCRSSARPPTSTRPAPYLVVDIGGGSTEFVLGTDAPEGWCRSTSGACASPSSSCTSDPPAPEELSNAVAVVRDHLADVPRAIPGAADAATLVGLAGTVTTVAAVELGLPEYDRERIHHFRLTRDGGGGRVPHARHRERPRNARTTPGLEPGRVDVIVGGALVLVAILRVLGFDEMLVSRGRHPRRSRPQPGVKPSRTVSSGSGRRRTVREISRSGNREIPHSVRGCAENAEHGPRRSSSTPSAHLTRRRHRTTSRRSLDSDTAGDEVDAWRATIAIDRALRHAHRTRQAARAPRGTPSQAVQRVAEAERHRRSPTPTSPTSRAPPPRSPAAWSPVTTSPPRCSQLLAALVPASLVALRLTRARRVAAGTYPPCRNGIESYARDADHRPPAARPRAVEPVPRGDRRARAPAARAHGSRVPRDHGRDDGAPAHRVPHRRTR